MAETFTLKRGLSNIYAAFVTKDENTEEGYVAGTPFHLIPAGELSVTVDAEKANTYFDNTVFAADVEVRLAVKRRIANDVISKITEMSYGKDTPEIVGERYDYR